MTLSSRLRKTVSLAALTAIAGSAALGGAASAATIDQPVILGPGQRIPINFAGYREPADKKLPQNYRLVRVHVELARSEHASTVLTAPKGFRIVTIGVGDGHQVGGVVDDVHYPGKRSVRVKLYANKSSVAQGQTADGTLYLLARRA
jgi:hypothetical protein